MVVFYQFLRLFLLFYVLCSTSFVNLTGFYTEDEPNFIISHHFGRHMLPILTSSLKHHIFSCFSDGSIRDGYNSLNVFLSISVNTVKAFL